MAGAEATNEGTTRVIGRFNEAWNRQDIESLTDAITDDAVFENTYPPPDGTRYAPDGTRYEGKDKVLSAWAEFFASSPQALFETEEMFASGERRCVRWLYRWTDADGGQGHVRGIDLFRVRDGKVAEKLSYVKG